jgi:hypothetical protein
VQMCILAHLDLGFTAQSDNRAGTEPPDLALGFAHA